jgi:hypothetical protein
VIKGFSSLDRESEIQAKEKRRSRIMKKLLSVAVAVVFLFAVVGTATAAKPAGNLAGAHKYTWHLSGAVMPVPPYGDYGTLDIPGSDTASKLIVNQPNGTTQVTITGVMNGLNANTEYTVYLSNGYTPYVVGWNIGNVSEIAISDSGADYLHITNLTQSGTAITGGTIVYPGYAKQITSGSVIGDHVEIWAVYTSGGSGTLHLTGTIANDGSITGTWTDTWPDEHGPVLRTDNWRNTIGVAVKTHTGSTGWPGLFTNSVQPFTFTTDAYGSGSWHINLKDSDFSTGTYPLSVWINIGGTILISDTFEVTR